jgi:uncharacterized protein YjbI with pentapeptide repeats
VNADLREAKFDCDKFGDTNVYADLRGAFFDSAQLQGASFEAAQVQGASFDFAELQGASLRRAQLQGASIDFAQLQGTSLVSAQLQGASLNFSHLQAAVLTGAQLETASLTSAELQSAALDMTRLRGATLESAQLQGASLAGAQLQGASLSKSNLRAASLQRAFVWRAQTADTDTEGARIVGPEADARFLNTQACRFNAAPYVRERFTGLTSMIEATVPDGKLKADALKRLAPLDPDNASLDSALDPPATRWKELASASPSNEKYEAALAASLQETGCAAEGAPYVIRGLLRRLKRHAEIRFSYSAGCTWRSRGAVPREYLFSDASPHPAALARAFLDETTCPGARGLSEEDKGRLREVIGTAAPAPEPPPPKFRC